MQVTDEMVRVAGTKYALDPLAPFPTHWRDAKGPITIMAGPVKGYLMCRRPGCTPFVLSVAQITNAKAHPSMGPFAPSQLSKRGDAERDSIQEA